MEKMEDKKMESTIMNETVIETPAITKKEESAPAQRSLLKFIILSILTLGIYPIVFYTGIGKELNRKLTPFDNRNTLNYCLIFFLLTPLTAGIASLVWFHHMSERIGAELLRRGYEKGFGSKTFWVWGVLGALILVGPLVYVSKLCKAMNTLAGDRANA